MIIFTMCGQVVAATERRWSGRERCLMVRLGGVDAGSGEVEDSEDDNPAVGVAEDVEDEAGAGVELGAPTIGLIVVAGVESRVGCE